jgi:hypothetical protein
VKEMVLPAAADSLVSVDDVISLNDDQEDQVRSPRAGCADIEKLMLEGLVRNQAT